MEYMQEEFDQTEGPIEVIYSKLRLKANSRFLIEFLIWYTFESLPNFKALLPEKYFFKYQTITGMEAYFMSCF